MEVTKEMEKYIEIILEDELDIAYPNSSPNSPHRIKVKVVTLKELRSRKDNLLSKAFRMAAHEAYENPNTGGMTDEK